MVSINLDRGLDAQKSKDKNITWKNNKPVRKKEESKKKGRHVKLDNYVS